MSDHPGSRRDAGAPSAVRHPLEAAILRRRRRQAVIEVFLIFCLFFVYAGWPVPDVNESHYLCKVKQVWDPDWLPGDFFLRTADAHPVFTWTLGWPTRFLSLPAFAWTGRVLTWLALAWAWRGLSHALVSRPWFALLSAAIFVAACDVAAPAGEWMIGGFEAKCPAYVLVLLGLERVARNRWGQAFLLLGAASAFHVLVGGWAVVAVGIAWLLAPGHRQGLCVIWPGLVGGFLLSLGGLIPALALNWGAAPGDLHEANWTYVFWRLPHHLDPASWGADRTINRAISAGACLLVWAAAFIAFRSFAAHRRLGGVVVGTALLAGIGCLIAFGLHARPALAAALLRFYWFRLPDVLIPLGFALWMTTFVSCWRQHWVGKTALVLAMAWAAAQMGLVMRERHGAPPRADKDMATDFGDWRDICRAARETTPGEARFLAPRMGQTFHWYAQRADVVNWKDIPQDAPSIVWWSQAIRDIFLLDDGPEVPLCDQDAVEVRDLAQHYKATHVITYADPPLDLPRVYSNRTYALYRVPPLPPNIEPADVTVPAQEVPAEEGTDEEEK